MKFDHSLVIINSSNKISIRVIEIFSCTWRSEHLELPKSYRSKYNQNPMVDKIVKLMSDIPFKQ